MIDFQNGVFIKLGPSDPKPIAAELAPILVEVTCPGTSGEVRIKHGGVHREPSAAPRRGHPEHARSAGPMDGVVRRQALIIPHEVRGKNVDEVCVAPWTSA